MKIKKIMFITFLLLAVLTIGAVSASDDVASDNLTVSDDSDIIAGEEDYDPDEHTIEINEEIDLDDDEEYIADITLPDNAKGRFQILNAEETVASLDVNKKDEDHWYDDEEGTIEGTIWLTDFDLEKVSDGDVLFFKFSEKLSNGDYVVIDSFTKICNVSLKGSTMILTDISEEITSDDIDIQVININPAEPDKNFTYVDVIEKEGFFIISVEGENDDIEIFKEDLSTTARPSVKIEDENDIPFYRFAFSFTDILNYIQNMGYADFDELVEIEGVESGNEIYFEIYEDDEDDETEIYSKTMTISINPNGLIVFGEENEYEDVEVDYGELNVVMKDNWQESDLMEFTILNGIDGKIVIYLNDNETPAFEKDLSELTPSETDSDYSTYIITIGDLNINQAGKYIIRDFFYDENEDLIYQYDDEDPETLTLYEQQIKTIAGVTFEVELRPTIGNDNLITINAPTGADDIILIYIDENEDPIEINLTDYTSDGDGNYNIGFEELKINLTAGEHDLKISYKGENFTPKINLTSNIVIELPENGEIIYTTFNDEFVWISLEDGEILGYEGKINLTIMDDEKNIKCTLEKDISELHFNNDEKSYTLQTGDMKVILNGTYNVVVRYFGGNETATQAEGRITFKTFDCEEYETSIKDTINNENDYAITFTAIPPSDEIIIEIDRNTKIKVTDSYLKEHYDSEGVYYIKSDKLKSIADGPHFIRVYIEKNYEDYELASGNVIIDLKENVDSALTITVTNIGEGSSANVVITTNSTFTGEVIVQIANKNYTVSVVEGKGSLPIAGLDANTYTVKALFKSNGIFNDSTKTTTFTVTSKPTAQDSQTTTPSSQPAKKANVIKLTLKKVKIKKSAKKLVIKATLKINGKAVKGKKITFKFKGKTYRAKTNKKGVAKITIKKKVLKKLKVGKKVTYSAKYSTKKVKRTVKVKK